MAGQVNLETKLNMITEDIAWLDTMPDTLEKSHIKAMLLLEIERRKSSRSASCSIADTQSKIDRLIDHCAALGAALVSDDSDSANESWRALPPDLQGLINERTEKLSESD